jgi:ABC-type lipoprotein export system ATPase subunit
MKLESLEYTQHEGRPEEWKLERCTFENINLFVGKNATGKSRILNIIGTLAKQLSRHRRLEYINGKYKAYFNKNGEKIVYSLEYGDQEVYMEELLVDNKPLMTRHSDGKGMIFSNELNRDMQFQTTINEVAAFAKRDSIQHPFLDDLYTWANSLIHFYFGTPLGKDTLIAIIKDNKKKTQIDLKKTDDVLRIFQKGKEEFGPKFISSIKNDMESISYEIEDIELSSPISFRIESTLPAAPLCLIVKESDLKGQTDQNDMSQGMFRALSLIVQINYAHMAKFPSCILIDDIGEGLDFERSTNLIKLIVEKAKDESFQLIMTTNDRFIMNNVPLQYWSIVHRSGNNSVCFNHRNSQKLFKEFEQTGLNNFDFFSSNYFLKSVDNND